jgi:hypothetical protein
MRTDSPYRCTSSLYPTAPNECVLGTLKLSHAMTRMTSCVEMDALDDLRRSAVIEMLENFGRCWLLPQNGERGGERGGGKGPPQLVDRVTRSRSLRKLDFE